MLEDWHRRDFEALIRFCRWYDAFQDYPFSLPDTYKVLDKAFPGSCFILSVRESSEAWLESMIRFHSEKFGVDGQPPDFEQLSRAEYRKPGFLARAQTLIYGIRPEQLYDSDIYQSHYEAYNADVRNYFANRPDDFLEVCLSDKDAYSRFCTFLEIEPIGDQFPWENRSGNGSGSKPKEGVR